MTLAELIPPGLERALPALTRRDVTLPGVSGKADVVIGMRRSGKTSWLFQEMRRLVDSGVPRSCILYVDLEDFRLGPVDAAALGEILDTFYALAPEARSRGAHIFLDEVQAVPGWARVVRRVLETQAARIYLAGSSARMLSTEAPADFRALGAEVELLPFSFRESLRHAGIDVPACEPGPMLRARLATELDDYLETGGFPDVQGLEPELRARALQGHVDLVLARDVVERRGHAGLAAARAVATALLGSGGRPFTLAKLYADLRPRGVGVRRDALPLLLDDLTDAYLVLTIEAFRRSARSRQLTPQKAYAIDPGLASAVSQAVAGDAGTRLETAVYLECRRRLGTAGGGSVSYYVSARGHEVDFVVGRADEPRACRLIQVCADFGDARARVRALGGVEEAMSELKVERATIVTLREREQVTLAAGFVNVVPAWRWFAGLE